MKMLLGTQLPPASQLKALRSFPNRYTRDNVPYWVTGAPAYKTPPYKLQFDSDADWLANTRFQVKADGSLALGSCESKPTWPDNPENRI